MSVLMFDAWLLRRTSSSRSAARWSSTTTGGTSAASTATTMITVVIIRRRRTYSAFLEAQPDAANRGDQTGRIADIAQLAPHRGHVRVEGPRRTPPVLVPHVAHDLLAPHRLAPVQPQVRQQVELLRAHRGLDAVDPDSPCCCIDVQPGRRHGGVARCDGREAESGADSCHEF